MGAEWGKGNKGGLESTNDIWYFECTAGMRVRVCLAIDF